MNSTRECVMECYTCREDHNENNPSCPLSSFDKVWEARTEHYLQCLGSSRQNVTEFNVYWKDVKLLLRMKYNNSGTMVGFYSGGKSHRGLSAKNMTML